MTTTIRMTRNTTALVEIDGPIITDQVRPLRVGDLLTAEVRETDEVEREYVGTSARYAASWLGWTRGQTPGYGDTPEAAVRALAAGAEAIVETEDEW